MHASQTCGIHISDGHTTGTVTGEREVLQCDRNRFSHMSRLEIDDFFVFAAIDGYYSKDDADRWEATLQN